MREGDAGDHAGRHTQLFGALDEVPEPLAVRI